MPNDDNDSQQQRPEPNPALQPLARLLGTWTVSGRTLESDEDDVDGRTTFEWLAGNFFMQQRLTMDFMDQEIHSLELIGFDADTEGLTSTVFSNMAPVPLPYSWEMTDDLFRIWTDEAEFEARFSQDGKSYSGGWRPRPGKEGPGNVAYDVSGQRQQN